MERIPAEGFSTFSARPALDSNTVLAIDAGVGDKLEVRDRVRFRVTILAQGTNAEAVASNAGQISDSQVRDTCIVTRIIVCLDLKTLSGSIHTSIDSNTVVAVNNGGRANGDIRGIRDIESIGVMGIVF